MGWGHQYEGLKLTINERQDLELEFVDFGPGPPTFAPKYLPDLTLSPFLAGFAGRCSGVVVAVSGQSISWCLED